MRATAGNGIRTARRTDEIKVVPQEATVRRQIRASAARAAAHLPRHRPLGREVLEKLGCTLVAETGLNPAYVGFGMVAISNAFWADQFAAVPSSRRLLLLPHCLRDSQGCAGTYSSLGLACVGCGRCELGSLKQEAEGLGYKVLIAEGTPAVVEVVLRGRADAILGVACLESLERAFERVVEMGIPHVAVPLLTDGCVDTTAELDLVRAWMRRRSGPLRARTRSFVPLLRAGEALFGDGALARTLAGHANLDAASSADVAPEPMAGTEALAIDWLRAGGKRFRPFITLASYAALVHGTDALDPEADLTDAFPLAVERTAVAIEALHKASLVHDDIEDDDVWRYGRQTLHRRYGVPNAVNIGDFLIGLGYRLVAAGRDEAGAACTADVLAHLAEAHVRLCRGQGAELLSRGRPPGALRPLDVLSIYSLKTAPAFEAAMYAGLRTAIDGAAASSGQCPEPAAIRPFARYLGSAYQVLNDLKDWDHDDHDKIVAGQDSLAARPTILNAFVFDAGDETQNRELADLVGADVPEETKLERLRDIYTARGAFDKAERLVQKYRDRARREADQIDPPALRELMHFVVETVL